MVYQLDGGTETMVTTVSKQAEDWYQLTGQIEVPAGTSSLRVFSRVVSSSAYLDDFRFQPVDATVTAYAYNEWGELSEVLDNNNLFTRYEYDAMGRLKSVHKETFQYGVNKISENKIHYKGQSN